jgi:hypothetical protein
MLHKTQGRLKWAAGMVAIVDPHVLAPQVVQGQVGNSNYKQDSTIDYVNLQSYLQLSKMRAN